MMAVEKNDVGMILWWWWAVGSCAKMI
jgi:hypothetical protein